MKRPPKITQDELQAAIEQARQAVHADVLTTRPPGAFTIYEYIGTSQLSRQTAHGQLKKLVRQGTHEQVMVSEVDTRGRRVVMAMYRKK